MTGKSVDVSGVYSSRTALEEALDKVRETGFRRTDISLLVLDSPESGDAPPESRGKASDRALAGASFRWLAGAGVLTVPNLGAFFVAGPLVAALAGAGAGGIARALSETEMPELQANRYEDCLREGGTLLSLHCGTRDWVRRAKEILRQTGAREIASCGEKSADLAAGGRPVPRVHSAGALGALADEVLRSAMPDARTRDIDDEA